MILDGIKGLGTSRKGTLCLLVLLVSGGLCAAGKVDSTAFAAIVSTVSIIYMHEHTKTDVAALGRQS